MWFLISAIATKLVFLAIFAWRWSNPPPFSVNTYEYSTLVPLKNITKDKIRCLQSVITFTTGPVFICLEDKKEVHLLPDHLPYNVRVLTGNDESYQNPKMGNLAKAWAKVTTPYVLILDDNILLHAQAEDKIFARMDSGVDVVTCPSYLWPEGEPLEAAFLNTFQMMMLYVADQFGWGFVIGKLMFFKKSLLNDFHEMDSYAEDAKLTKVAWRKGLRTGHINYPFFHLSSMSTYKDILNRQLRWLLMRRKEWFPFWIFEPLSSNLVTAGQMWYFAGWEFAGIFISLAYFLECVVMEMTKTNTTLYDMLLRDILIPVLWIMSIFKRSAKWHDKTV